MKQYPLFLGSGRESLVCRVCGAENLLGAMKADKTKPLGAANICKACHRRAMTKRYLEKRAEINARATARADKEKKREYDRRRRPIYYKKARLRMLAKTNERRGRIRSAVPGWANKFFIEEIYRLATLRTAITGAKWEVDHIIPVSSAIVCGLHCEDNLRVIPEMENKRKTNLFWPDMP